MARSITEEEIKKEGLLVGQKATKGKKVQWVGWFYFEKDGQSQMEAVFKECKKEDKS